MVSRWCNDDQNRNMLYRKDGSERYPEFKLYKMIARNVHHHIPSKEMYAPIFSDFVSEVIDESKTYWRL